MNYKVYILFSTTKDRYYIGCTADVLDERLRKHNTNHKGFTGSVNDWTVVYCENYDSKTDALKREKTIKNWKSRAMLKKLIENKYLTFTQFLYTTKKK